MGQTFPRRAFALRHFYDWPGFHTNSTLPKTFHSPTERLPFLVYNGEVVADSEFMIAFLSKEFSVSVDAHLTPQQHALGRTTRRMVESSLSFASYRSVIVDHGYSLVPFFAREFGVPMLAAKFAIWQIRRKKIEMLNTVGHGDLTAVEYCSEMLRDYQCLEALIGDKKFLLEGDAPTSYDCGVFAILHIFPSFGVSTPQFDYVRKSAILSGYVARMMTLLFPDIDALKCEHKQPSRKYAVVAGTCSLPNDEINLTA